MKGLIEKDFILLRRMDKKLPIIMYVIVMVTNFIDMEILYAFLASVLFSACLSIHMMMTMTYDGMNKWKRTEMILPLSNFQEVLAKYLFTFSGSLISSVGACIIYLLHYAIFNVYDNKSFFCAIVGCLIIPILWSSICLPFAYCLDYGSTQYIRIIIVLIILYFIRDHRFNDVLQYITELRIFPTLCIGLLLIIVSFTASVVGHRKRE